MGLILDLAVAALALAVIGSLALLAWTLGVSAVRSVRSGREAMSAARRSVAESEARLVIATARTRSALESLEQRTAPMTPKRQPTPTPTPGEQPDA